MPGVNRQMVSTEEAEAAYQRIVFPKPPWFKRCRAKKDLIRMVRDGYIRMCRSRGAHDRWSLLAATGRLPHAPTGCWTDYRAQLRRMGKVRVRRPV